MTNPTDIEDVLNEDTERRELCEALETQRELDEAEQLALAERAS